MLDLSVVADPIAYQHARQSSYRGRENGAIRSVIGTPASIDAWQHLRECGKHPLWAWMTHRQSSQLARARARTIEDELR